MDAHVFLFSAMVGALAGVASGLFGIGGGTIIVPSMLMLGLSAHHAIGISVIQMIFSSVFGSLINYKKRLLSLHDGLFLGLGGLIGASFSGVIVRWFSDIELTTCFLILTCYSFYSFLFKKKSQNNHQALRSSVVKTRLVLVFAGALTGIFAISLGIGGGLIMIPILMYFLNYDTKKTSVLSLFFIIFSSVSGSYSFFLHGVITPHVIHIGLIVGMASMAGVSIGIWSIQKISSIWHRRILSLIYIFSILSTSWGLYQKLG